MHLFAAKKQLQKSGSNWACSVQWWWLIVTGSSSWLFRQYQAPATRTQWPRVVFDRCTSFKSWNFFLRINQYFFAAPHILEASFIRRNSFDLLIILWFSKIRLILSIWYTHSVLCLESCTKPHSQSPSDQEHCYITKTACLYVYIPSSGWMTKCFAPFPHIPHQVSPTTCPGTKEGVQMDRSCKRGEALSLRYFSHPPNVYQTLLWVFCHLIFVGNNYDVVHRSKMTKTLGVSMRPASHSIISLSHSIIILSSPPWKEVRWHLTEQ